MENLVSSNDYANNDAFEYKFSEVFDLKEIQKIQDLFSAATGVAGIITEPDGTPITVPSGFCTLCNEIVRKTETGFKNCRLSDSIIGSPNPEGPRIQKCFSGGLVDGGASIIVDGRHIANWLIGQVLIDDYRLEDLIGYADVIGVDRETYINALKQVKRMSRQQFETICSFLFFNAQQLSKYAVKNAVLSREIDRKIMNEIEIKKINSQLEIKVQERTQQLLEINAELEETNAMLEEEITERQKAEEEIKQLNEELEAKVIERTIQLQDINATLEEEISERIKVEEALRESEVEYKYLSYHDKLTGLYNRRFYEEEIRRLDTERNLPISIILGDVNGLKLVNDAFGHSKGDELLQKAAASIRSSCRAEDIVARWGGDEFVILLPKTPSEEAEKIVKRIKEQYINEHVNAIRVSISFGWDTKTHADEDILKVLRSAEDYMYKHKIIENEGVRGNIINTIINTLHEKNPREEQHSKRVSEICQNIGKAIGFSEIEIGRLRVVGLLHDIGKIAIEEGILNKPGKLTKNEWDEIKQHPGIGYRILSSSHELIELAECTLLHHERWDGKGYPKGLKGEAIPIVSRIITIADSYDAMTTERPYRKALSEEEAIIEIQNNAGIQFDPQIARIFVEKVLNQAWE